MKNLTVAFRPDEEGHPLELLHVGGGDMAGALVVPLPLGVQRVQLDATSRIMFRHIAPDFVITFSELLFRHLIES